MQHIALSLLLWVINYTCMCEHAYVHVRSGVGWMVEQMTLLIALFKLAIITLYCDDLSFMSIFIF